MAKQIRMITASEDVQPLVDRGADVNVELKNLTYEDKGIKVKLSAAAAQGLEEGETSLKLKGNAAIAVVSAVEKFSINANAQSFGEVSKAVDNGEFQGVVERGESIHIPPELIGTAAEILKKSGINAMIGVSYSVDANGYRALLEKQDADPMGEKLKGCVEKDITYRIKYEQI